MFRTHGFAARALSVALASVLSTACVGMDTVAGPSSTKKPSAPAPQPAACQFAWSFPRVTYPSGGSAYSMHLPPGSTYRINVSSTCGWRPQTTVVQFGAGISAWGFNGNTGYIDLYVNAGASVSSFGVYVDADVAPFPRLASGSICPAPYDSSCGAQ